MLRLLTPRIIARCAGRERQLDLDEATFAKSRARLENALAGGRVLTRTATYDVLERAGIATAEQRAGLEEDDVEGVTYWSAPTRSTARVAPVVHLLPAWDEYTVAYKDRSAFLDPAHAAPTRNGIFSPVVLVDGRIVGTWARKATRDNVRVTLTLLEPVSRSVRGALGDAASRYGVFLGLSVTVGVVSLSQRAP